MRRPQIKKARQHARSLIARYNITRPPIHVDKIAQNLGLTVKYSPFDQEISGMIFFRDDVTIVGINALHHKNRQRFTLAHECGHYLLHREQILGAVHVDKKYPGLLRSDISSVGIDPIEIEANQFAAELLVPEEMLMRQINGTTYDFEYDGLVKDLAAQFEVSSQMMSNSLANLRTR